MSDRKSTEHVSGRFYAAVKYSAARRGIEFNLSIEDMELLLIQQDFKCAYTNEVLDLKTRNKITGSLDRIDSNLSYEINNVQFLKKEVNLCKWTLTEKEFFDMISSIYENKLHSVTVV